jgi:hypothetical protein
MYSSALLAAAEEGHAEIARLLVDKGADINVEDGDFGSALQVLGYIRLPPNQLTLPPFHPIPWAS